MSVPPSLPHAEPADARRSGLCVLVVVAYRQAGVVLLCALVGSAVSATLYLRQPRLYTSAAKVWVQPERQGAPAFLADIAAYRETPSADPVNRRIETEIGLMLTRTNAQAVVRKYAIDDSQLVHGGLARPWRGPDAASSPDGSSRTVDLFLDGLSVQPLRSKTADTASNVLEVRFECTDQALAPKALQAFLDNYLQLRARQDRRLGETASRLVEAKLARAADDVRQAEDRIVALVVQDGGRAGRASGAANVGDAAAEATTRGSLRLDLSPGAAVGAANAGPTAVALRPQTLALRLDEARQPATDDAGDVRHRSAQLAGSRQRLVRTVREDTQLAAALNRLERARQVAQERYVELQRQLDQIDLYLRLDPAQAERGVIIDAPDHPAAAEGRQGKGVAWLGPVAGLLLGLLLATLRELGGDRMRSPREAERALGVPVLGAIPTLSAKAMNGYFGPSTRAPDAPSAELA